MAKLWKGAITIGGHGILHHGTIPQAHKIFLGRTQIYRVGQNQNQTTFLRPQFFPKPKLPSCHCAESQSWEEKP